MEWVALIEQVVQLAAVDLIEADLEVVVREAIKEIDDVECGQEVKARHGAVIDPHHGERLARAGLPVCKTGRICAFKRASDQWHDTLFIDLCNHGKNSR